MRFWKSWLLFSTMGLDREEVWQSAGTTGPRVDHLIIGNCGISKVAVKSGCSGGVLRAEPGIQLCSARNRHRLAGFTFLCCLSRLSPTLLDDPLFEQCKDDCFWVFIKQPNDVRNSHVAIEEEVADHEGSFGL